MLLELKHIYKDYMQDKIVIPVLKDINISIDEGEYVCILPIRKRSPDRFANC